MTNTSNTATTDMMNAQDLDVTHGVDPTTLPATFLAIYEANDSGRSAGLAYKFVVGQCPNVPDLAAIERAAAERAAAERAAAERAAAERAAAERAAHLAKQAESREQCDTDGFVSQHFDGLNAGVAAINAEIAARGGYDIFPGLFDRKTGARVPAVLCSGPFGYYWNLCDAVTGKKLFGKPAFINDTRGPRGAPAKCGYVVLGEWAPAKGSVVGEGRGLSGLASCRTTAVRIDGGYPGRPR